MQKVVKEFSAKTSAEAIELGLKELGKTAEEVEIEVVEEGKKKLFGSVKAVVRISYDEMTEEDTKVEETEEETTENGTDGERAVAFLKELFSMLNMDVETELTKEEEKIEISVKTNNTSEVIGKRGQILDALQTLAGAVANTGREDYKRVVVDCENYRENREETLKKLAGNLEKKAVRMGRKIKLEAMNPYERRIIHSALAESTEVKTVSEGKEPNRYVVIIPNNEEGDLPAIPARSERRGGGNQRYGRKPYGNRGGQRNGGRKPYGNNHGFKKPAGGQRRSQSTDFFGTFLGNSKDEQ